jgi:general secretion pathway protein A
VYENFYGLREKPFNMTPDPRFLYRSESHRDAMAYLTYGVFEKKGFIVLQGEVGVGKTTVLRAFVDLFQPSLDAAFVFSTRLTFRQLLYLILQDLGLEVGRKDKVELLSELNRFLLHQAERKRNTVVMIDEAHNLRPEVLEELRMLSNLETSDQKLLQIALVGQPELQEKLSLSELRQLRQRIPGICTIRPLLAHEVSDYVKTRLRVAGSSESDVLFTDEALGMVYRYSGGIPRLINVLCDRALLLGFADSVRRMDGRMVTNAIRDLNPNGGSPYRVSTQKPY